MKVSELMKRLSEVSQDADVLVEGRSSLVNIDDIHINDGDLIIDVSSTWRY